MKPLIVFAPGAGASCTSPWMLRYAQAFSDFANVEAFDYPYRLAGRRAPDPLPKLIAAHEAAVAAARAKYPGPVFLIGKSMGGRVGCHLSLEVSVDGVVCLGYPLRGAGKKAPLRDAVLLAMTTRVLFVQGTRDPLCPLPDLDAVLAKMQAPHSLYVVEGGDHSLELTKGELKTQGRTPEHVMADVVAKVRAFVIPREP